MGKFLNDFQMRLVRIIRALVVIYSIGMLGCGVYILAKTKSSETFEPALLFPIIFGVCWLLNVYRFNKELKANKNKISWFRIKIYFFTLGRVVFASLSFFFITTRDIWNAFCCVFFFIFTVLIQMLLYHVENKKNTTEK